MREGSKETICFGHRVDLTKGECKKTMYYMKWFPSTQGGLHGMIPSLRLAAVSLTNSFGWTQDPGPSRQDPVTSVPRGCWPSRAGPPRRGGGPTHGTSCAQKFPGGPVPGPSPGGVRTARVEFVRLRFVPRCARDAAPRTWRRTAAA